MAIKGIMGSDEFVRSRAVDPSDRSHIWSRRVLKGVIIAFFVIYSLGTIAPFYFLFVRTFVSTKDSTELHLWIPPMEEANLNYNIGNLSVFYNLDLQQMKEDLGIPPTIYLNPKWSLKKVGKEFGISEEELRTYFRPFSRYLGWIVLFRDERFWPSILRTVLLTVSGIIGVNLLSILTATALAGLRRRDQMFVYNFYLLQTVIPAFLILLPQMTLVKWVMGLIPGAMESGMTRQISQLLMLALMYMQGGALSVMIFTSFISTMPTELENSAEIDGASRWEYIWHILLPNMKVPVASLTVIRLPRLWNDFLRPFVYLDPDNSTFLPLIQGFTGQFTTNFQVVFTGVFVSILPLLTIYIIFRRWFVQGVMAGAVKG